jgi:hypothetical protein
MKALVALVALSAFLAGPAFAQAPSRNHAFHQQSSSRVHSNRYQSDAQGSQPYPNPDRELYAPDTTPPD